MNGWELAVYVAVALVGLAAMAANSFFREPSWLKEDPPLRSQWRALTFYSLASGMLFGFAAALVNHLEHWNQQSIVFASLGGYMFFQSIFTDMRLRYVDRWGQRIANVSSLAVGIYVLSQFGLSLDWVLYVSFLAVTVAIQLLPGIGDSDARAFTYAVLAVYPVAGVDGLRLFAVGFLAALLLYYVGLSVHERKFNFKGLLTKLSFPLVPIIMAPALLVTLIGRVFV